MKYKTRKIFFIIIGFLVLFSFVAQTKAADCVGDDGIVDPNDTCGLPKGIGITTIGGILPILSSIFKVAYVVFFSVSAFMVIIAAYEYLTAGDESEKISGAHKRLKWAAIAVAVALLSVSFNMIVKNFIKP